MTIILFLIHFLQFLVLVHLQVLKMDLSDGDLPLMAKGLITFVFRVMFLVEMTV